MKIVPGDLMRGTRPGETREGGPMPGDHDYTVPREDRMVPFRFSAKRLSGDAIDLDGWNEDGTGEGPTIALTQASAIQLIAEVSAALNQGGL